MVGISDTFVASCARASVSFFAGEGAARSEGLPSVRGDSAAIPIAGRARVGSLGETLLCMMCGLSREVVDRWFRLGTSMKRLMS